jgi:hypothetical protein
MKAALLLGMLAISAGCSENDLSLSIVQMQAVSKPSCIAMAAAAGAFPGRARGLLDVAQITSTGYVAIPIVRNNLVSRPGGGMAVEYNSIQLTGANVSIQPPPGMSLPSADANYFFPSAPGRVDPAGLVPMPVEVVTAKVARELGPSIPGGGLLTVIATVRPVGELDGNTQVIGGPMQFPVDLCENCLVTNQVCPFPKNSTPAIGGCFPQQDDILNCCTCPANVTIVGCTPGQVLCGASAPVSAM